MRILAIESSGRECSIAALEDGDTAARLIDERPVAGHGRTAQALAPALKQLLEAVAWTADAIELIAVTVGPGSFTGLRIGVTTAKTLAYAVGAQVIGVDTLEVLAQQAANHNRPLWTIVDAQRQELFAAHFAGDCPNSFESANRNGTVPFAARRVCTVPTHIVPQTDWLARLQPGDLVTGPALTRLQSQLPAGVDATDPACWQPTAAATGQLAWRDHQAGRRDDLWKLTPHYHRLSAAEEKRARS